MVNPVLRNIAAGERKLPAYSPGRSIAEVAAERGLADVVKLASNENPLGAGAAAMRALRDLSAADVSRYPDGDCRALRRALSERLNVRPERLIFGNGSNEILELAARLMLSGDGAAVFSRHSFAVYGLAVAAHRGRAIVVDSAAGYAHDLDAMARAAAAPDARLMFIANPNNPTGGWHSPAAIAKLMSRVPLHVLVVLDEAYREYAGDGADAAAANLLITRTFSKIHGLAGLRAGFGIGDAEIIAMLNRIRQPFNVGCAAQAAAAAAVGDDAHVARSVEMNAAGMSQIAAGLDDMQIRRLPSRANFITFHAGAAAAQICDGLLNDGVIVRPLAGYEMPEWLRVSVGLESENARFLRALARLLQK